MPSPSPEVAGLSDCELEDKIWELIQLGPTATDMSVASYRARDAHYEELEALRHERDMRVTI